MFKFLLYSTIKLIYLTLLIWNNKFVPYKKYNKEIKVNFGYPLIINAIGHMHQIIFNNIL